MHKLPYFEKGTITSLTESEGQDGYVFKYEVELNSVSKEDIDEFCKSFEGLTVTEGEKNIYIVTSDRINTYTVSIRFNEENSTAKIVMSAMQ